MCDRDFNSASINFSKTPPGKEINQEIKIPKDQDKNGKGGLTNASNEDNNLRPTTIDQLPKAFHEKLEENAANVVATLGGCSFKSCSNKVAEQHKPINTPSSFDLPLHQSAPKVILFVSEPLASVFTLEQVKLMNQWMEERETN